MTNSVFSQEDNLKIVLIEVTSSEVALDVAYALRGYCVDNLVVLTSANEFDYAALEFICQQQNANFRVKVCHRVKLANLEKIESEPTKIDESLLGYTYLDYPTQLRFNDTRLMVNVHLIYNSQTEYISWLFQIDGEIYEYCIKLEVAEFFLPDSLLEINI